MFRGCDPEALRGAASFLENEAHRIEELVAGLQEGIAAVDWHGPDADAYRADAASSLEQLVQSLLGAWRRRVQLLVAEADEQDEVSAADGAVGARPDGQAGHPAGPAGGGPSSTGPAAPGRGGPLPGFPGPDLLSGPWARLRWAQERERLAEQLSEIRVPPGPSSPLPTGEAPSAGLIVDALGPAQGAVTEREWNTISQGSAAAGMAPVVGASQAAAVGAVNVQLGRYEKIQGLREGDPFKVVDGYVTEKLGALDGTANALELTPLAPLGSTFSQVTGPLNGAWHTLRGMAMDREDSGEAQDSSPTRMLFDLPRRAVDEGVRPVGEWIGGPTGAALGAGADVFEAEHRRAEATIDRTGQAVSEHAQDNVPLLREALSVPRRTVELPRRGPDSLSGP